MSYTVLASATLIDDTKKELYSVPEKNGAVVSLFISATDQCTVSIYVRTTTGQDDTPIVTNIHLDPGNSYDFKGVYIHARQTLVVKGMGAVVLVSGYGFIAPDGPLVKGGKLYNKTAYRDPAAPFMTMFMEDMDVAPGLIMEGDLFIHIPKTAASRLVKIYNSSVIPTDIANSKADQLCTYKVPDISWISIRKLLLNRKYIHVDAPAGSTVFYQFNMRKDA